MQASNILSDIPLNIKNQYTFVRELGRGSYGVVCLYQKQGQNFAVKLEKSAGNIQSLTMESIILKKINEMNQYQS